MIGAFISTAFFAFFLFLIGVPIFFWGLRQFGLFAVVKERHCHVYLLFGNVVGVIDKPGLHFLPFRLGLAAFFVNWIGKRYVVDMRLDQEYLRSQPVNSEEGAPMGIGVWYEMFVSDPVAYLFKNMDPRGSLRANVSNTSVRCLSNMPLADMLETRHTMSQTVRSEVSPRSHEWGYRLGSVYIRKVHFRDVQMIRQIEEKVVNRLRQVTSAIQQDGANQVSIIRNTAERQAAVEFARATAIRAEIVGGALERILRDRDVAEAMFQVLETQKLLENKGGLTLVPRDAGGLMPLLASRAREQTPPSSE
jgi:regulator of protease activity HflC (stomatin/prohibitin superfamily)